MKLVYKTYGTGDPVIILHGLFGMGDNWRSIARMMEDQHQCIVADLRNHGRSPHDPVMNLAVMTDDLLELLEDLQLKRASFIGHSMGGKVAMQFALLYPDLVDKLVVVDIAPKHYPPHHARVIEAILAADPSHLRERSEVEERLASHLGQDQSTIQFLMKNLSRTPEGHLEWKSNMPVIIDAYQNLMEEVTPLAPFTGPVLFVRGEKSKYILDEDLPLIHDLFPEAKLITIPGAGHWVHADAPQAFTAAVMDFLQ